MNDDKKPRARDKVVGAVIFGILVVIPFSIRIAYQGLGACPARCAINSETLAMCWMSRSKLESMQLKGGTC
jgi:hypothetical protein